MPRLLTLGLNNNSSKDTDSNINSLYGNDIIETVQKLRNDIPIGNIYSVICTVMSTLHKIPIKSTFIKTSAKFSIKPLIKNIKSIFCLDLIFRHNVCLDIMRNLGFCRLQKFQGNTE